MSRLGTMQFPTKAYKLIISTLKKHLRIFEDDFIDDDESTKDVVFVSFELSDDGDVSEIIEKAMGKFPDVPYDLFQDTAEGGYVIEFGSTDYSRPNKKIVSVDAHGYKDDISIEDLLLIKSMDGLSKFIKERLERRPELIESACKTYNNNH